jgi:predicted DsbA family dithiol-disulfide isomerase
MLKSLPNVFTSLSRIHRNIAYKTSRFTHQMATQKTIKVDIVSDNICPWCFVGRRRLEKGVEMYNEENQDEQIKLEVHWHPFELDPTLSPIGEDKQQRYLKKFGPQFKLMEQRLHSVGKTVGIEFKSEGMVGKTIDSHRLVEYVQEEMGWEKANDLIEVLFHGYFEESKNITDIEWLAGCYMKVNPDGDRAKVLTFLKGDVKRKQVQDEALNWARKGIGGVPYFIFENKFTVSGAQDSDLFKDLLEDLVARR